MPPMPPMPPITQALILINVGVFCMQFLFGPQFERWLILFPVGAGLMPWQLLTYAFLHGDPMHLIFNMLGLWMFGSELERIWNRKRFLLFCAACVVSAALANLCFSAVVGSMRPMLGASGLVFGFLLAYAMLFPNRTIMMLIPPIPMKAKYYALLFGTIELVFGVAAPMGSVAHFAHLGGMLGAFLMLRFWRGQPPFGRRR